MAYRWILFCPKFASTPSSPRVMLWRRARSFGCVGLDNGLWIVPRSAEAERFIRKMQSAIEGQGGSSHVFLAEALNPAVEKDILDRFRRDRAQDYFEVVEQCDDFLADIDKEIRRRNYSYAEYEENEQDFEKLEGWFAKVKKRDFLGSAEAIEARARLEKCRKALQKFAENVFTYEKRGKGKSPRPALRK
jgi:hypothetical protein